MEQLYEEAKDPGKTGFFAEITGFSGKVMYLVFECKGKKSVYVVHLQKPVILANKVEKYAKKGMKYLKYQGPAALWNKTVSKVKTVSTREIPYSKWIEEASSHKGRTGKGATDKI